MPRQRGIAGIEAMMKLYLPFFKRLLDLLFSGIILVALSPLLAGICVWIKLDSEGPVFFKQKRIARGKRHFNILKFRTMRTDTPHDVPTHLLTDPEKWITPSGRFLRKTSLDELPQLFNIFLGDMSFVGPRPALWNQADLIAARDTYGANDVPQGLTGWAQVHGRDELEIAEKAALDGYYAAHAGLWMDIKCLFLTARCVVAGKGYREGKAEPEKGKENT